MTDSPERLAALAALAALRNCFADHTPAKRVCLAEAEYQDARCVMLIVRAVGVPVLAGWAAVTWSDDSQRLEVMKYEVLTGRPGEDSWERTPAFTQCTPGGDATKAALSLAVELVSALKSLPL